jgi:O-antigen/teichoic acid export membrane protein
MIKNLKSIGFNQSVAYSFLSKGWLLISGLITSFLVASSFSPEMQGYYYTFNSLLVITVFAELGLTSVLVNFVSHEWLHLSIDKERVLIGDDNQISRLVSLCYFSSKWFAFAALFTSAALIMIGWYFLGSQKHSSLQWELPWVALAITTGLNLLFLPVSAVLEGCNQVKNLYKYRFIQYLITSIVVWNVIYFGAGLWTASISITVGLLATITMYLANYRHLLGRLFFKKPKFGRVNWRDELLPMQWRIALSWIGGYFTFALFVPVLFRYQNPILAGQMGMTWTFIGALMSISSAWIAPHSPGLGLLVASKNYHKLDEKFKKINIVNFYLTIFGSACLMGGIVFLNIVSPKLAIRLLPPEIVAIFLLGTIIYSQGLPLAAYLRAHKQEPLTAVSVLTGLLNGLLVIFFGMKYAALGIALAYLTSTSILFPFMLKIFYSKKKEWHENDE